MKAASLPNLNRETTSFPNFFTFYQDPNQHDPTTLHTPRNIDHSEDSEPSETSPFKDIFSPFVSFNELNENHYPVGGSFYKWNQMDQTLPRRPPSPNGSDTNVSVGSNQFSGNIGLRSEGPKFTHLRWDQTLPNTSSVGSNQLSGNVGAPSEGPNFTQLRWYRGNYLDFPEDEFRRAFKMSKSTVDWICTQLETSIVDEKHMMLQLALPSTPAISQRVAVCILHLATHMDSSSPENLFGDRKKLLQDLIRGYESVNQLRLILEKPLGDDKPSVAVDLVTKILGSLTESLLILTWGPIEEVFDKIPASTGGNSPSSNGWKYDESEESSKSTSAFKERRRYYKRRKTIQTLTKITPNLVDDGHAWRKYGQKVILNAKHPRRATQTVTTISSNLIDDGYTWRKHGQKDILDSKHPRNYYRCTHKFDQGGQATKQVQQTEEDPPMYQITYHGNHSCKAPVAPNIILESVPLGTEVGAVHNGPSNVSMDGPDLTTETVTTISSNLIDDGYAWRKYGEEVIPNAKHPRNYFRCTHKHDQGCLATKQVQRIDEDPPMYQTT